VTDFIRDRYGRQGLRDLVAAYVDGATCEGGVYRALGIALEGLESQWLASLTPQSALAAFWQRNGAWVILLILFAALPFVFVLPSHVRATALGDESL
jgi:hypothetical protein